MVIRNSWSKGPKESGHYATLPTDTNILSVTISDGICYVNFDEKVQQTTVGAKADTAIYSIVDSLVQVCQVDNVQFSINGETNSNSRKSVPLDQLFAWDGSYLNIQWWKRYLEKSENEKTYKTQAVNKAV